MSWLLPFCPDGLGAVPEMRSWEVAGGICMKRRKNKNKPKTGMRTLKSTKREAVHQRKRLTFLFFKEKTIFFSFCPAGERWKFQKIVRNFPQNWKKNQKIHRKRWRRKKKGKRKWAATSLEGNWSCGLNGLKLLSVPLCQLQYRQQRSLQGYIEPPQEIRTQWRERGI